MNDIQIITFSHPRTYFDPILQFAMMMSKNIFIFAQTVVLISLPVIFSEKYQYYLFENFEMTKDCFIKEQGINKALQINRQNLHHKIDTLNQRIYIDQQPSSTIGSNTQKRYTQNFHDKLKFTWRLIYNRYQFRKLSVWSNFHSLYHKVKDNFNFFFDFQKVYQRSTQEIMDGALKGLVMLQETYEQDIKDFSKGHLHIKHKNTIERTSRNIDSLQPDDLAAMSTLAFEYYKWYDNSLTYLKEALKSYYSLSHEQRREMPTEDFEKSLLTMKKHYTSYHNQLLQKKDNILGESWKLYPYPVDKGLRIYLLRYRISSINIFK